MNKMGFGFLRLPRLDPGDEKSVDYGLLNEMVDRFLALGGRYFDTAYTYLGGVSEEALRRSLVERHPRDCFQLADKLPGYKVTAPEQREAFFQESLDRCGVDYFDVYLLHWLNRKNYAIAEQFDEFRFLEELKAAGRVGRIGFSYHDGPELLDEILTRHPEVDLVQLQLNYLDWDSPSIQARACYEAAVRHGKPVVVMEPVKGGTLAAPPAEAAALLEQSRPGDSPARWALRFAQSLPGVETVLSGMNTMAQMEDNMAEVRPMTAGELETCARAAGLIRGSIAVACTGCRYCTAGCPKGISIPDIFRLYNDYARSPGEDWKIIPVYDRLAARTARASDCIGCRRCEGSCPQQLPITDWLKKAAEAFEKDK